MGYKYFCSKKAKGLSCLMSLVLHQAPIDSQSPWISRPTLILLACAPIPERVAHHAEPGRNG